MASNTNTVTVSGTLVKDPEEIANGQGVQFSIAVNENFKDKATEEWKEYANFFDIKAWGGQAKPVLNHLVKGSRVVVSGRLKQERWVKDDKKQSKVTINASNVEFMPKSTQSAGSSGASEKTADDDDDIPF